MFAQLPDNVWDQIFRRLHLRDKRTLRRVSTAIKEDVDERIRSYRELKMIIERTTSPRMLLRTVYVPQRFHRMIPDPRHSGNLRPSYAEPSAWNISTMTVVSYLSTPLDPRSVFHCVDVVDFKNMSGEQLRDLQVAKAECECERAISPNNSSVSSRCIRNECGCLAAFFPGILDIHYQTYCRGDPDFAEVKAKKRGRAATRSFENQCTMRICMGHTGEGAEQKNGQQWNVVNLKMFQNGKIQMTGCKSAEQARSAVQVLLRKLMEKAPAMRFKRDCMTQLRCFALGADEDMSARGQHSKILASIEHTANVNSTSTTPFIINQMIEQVLLRVDNESLFSCRRVNRFFRHMVHHANFWRQKCERELRCECALDAQGWHMTSKYNGRFQRMERVRRPEHFAHPRLLYTRYRSLRRHRPFLVVEQFEELFIAGEQVAMINSDFRTNFELNLPRLFKIFYRSYGNHTIYGNDGNAAVEEDGDGDGDAPTEFDVDIADQQRGRIIHAHYSPDDYVAINVKYLSPIPPDLLPNELAVIEEGIEDNTVISFFIFRTGSVIINSARNEAQLRDAYEFINGIFRDCYTEIWHPPSRQHSSGARRQSTKKQQHKRQKNK